MGNCPMHHVRVTNAANKISEACLELEDAVSYDSSYRPLLDAACRLSKRVRARWMKNGKIGRKEGWFK